MEKESKKNSLIIILLSIIATLLVVIGISLYLKMEHLDDRDDYGSPENNNNYDHDDIEYNNNYISSTEALKIAIDNLNISKNDIYDISSDLDYKYGKTVYEVEFKYDRNEYEYYIDATTGEIIKSFKERD